MRILMLDNEFPPLGGGTGVVNQHLLEEFARVPDLWIDLVTSSRTPATYETMSFSERITIYKVPVDNHNIHHSSNIELLRYTLRGLVFSFQLLRKNHYDSSFAFSGVPAGVMSWILNLITGLPYIVSLQGPDVPGFEARYSSIYPFLKPLLRQVWKAAAVVTAISRDHQRLAHATLPGLDIPIIYNGVDSKTFRSLPPQRQSLNILCVGRLIERKGQHFLIQAFSNLRRKHPDLDLKLTLAGTGDGESMFKALARECGVAAQVSFLGCVPQVDMPKIYQEAALFVLPSQNEGMSIALLEAMAAGLPVVVTPTGGTEELVTPGENGLVVNWADVSGLEAALERLVLDPTLRQSMGSASRRMALRFSWNQVAKQYLDRIYGIRTAGSLETAL